jgi:ribosomal protein S12 methylthiotransferase
MDLYGEPRLVELLNELDKVEGIQWIRLMYLYPMYVSDELIDTIADSKKIVPYLDMPLQHINDTMLKRMARRVNRTDTVDLLNRMRSRISNLVLRTTFITGFPGETQEQFEELRQFILDQKFERMGAFTYSYESDTPSAILPDHISEEVMNERRDLLMEAQQQVAFEWNEAQVGKQLDVIIDQPVPGETTAWQGRSFADAPDVDGLVWVTGENVTPGEIVRCEIVASQGYDLIAVAL